MRKLIGTTTAVLAAAVLMLPATASAGVVQFSGNLDRLTDVEVHGDFACTGQPSTVAGSGLTSGSFRVTETVKLGAHVQVAMEGSVTLYEASDRRRIPSSAPMSARGRTRPTKSSSGHPAVRRCSPASRTERSCSPTAARQCSRSVSFCSSLTARSCSLPRLPAAESDALGPLRAWRPGHDPGLRLRRRSRGSHDAEPSVQ